jgi:hypothetical protein
VAPSAAAVNPFAKIQLAAPTTSVTTTTTTTTTAGGFPGFSATTSTAAAPTASSGDSKLEQLGKAFEKYQSTVDIATDPSKALLQYMVSHQTLIATKENSASKSSSKTTTTTSSSSGSANTSTSLFGGGGSPSPAAPFASKSQFPSMSAPAPSSASSSNEPPKPLFPSAGSGTSAPVVPFSFATPSSSTGSTSTPTFSFGKPVATLPPAAAVPTPAPAASNNANANDDDAPVPAEEATAPLEKADVDWEELLEVNVRFHRMARGKKDWSKAVKGPLKVQEHKSNSSRRIVMRDGAGKVLLNVGISKGMSFEKNTEPPTKPGKGPRTTVRFMGLESNERGPETFLIICRPDMLDEFHGKLEELANK